jgi:hypothetical protein
MGVAERDFLGIELRKVSIGHRELLGGESVLIRGLYVYVRV